MNKQQLIEIIAEENEITKDMATRTLNTMIRSIMTSVKNGEPVVLVGFGTFRQVNYTLYFYDVCCNALLLLLFCTLSCFFALDNRFDLNGCTSTQTVYFPGGVFLVFQINIPTRSERFCSARNSSHYLTGCFPKIPAGARRPDLR